MLLERRPTKFIARFAGTFDSYMGACGTAVPLAKAFKFRTREELLSYASKCDIPSASIVLIEV